MAEADALTCGLLVKTIDGNVRRNPLVKVASDAAGDMVRFAGHFGMTRLRLAASQAGCTVSRRAAPGSLPG